MPRPSSIELLPADVKTALVEWLNDPRITQQEATDRVNALLRTAESCDAVSKSAVNRYSVQMKSVTARMRQSREVARIFMEQFGTEPQGETGMMINSGLMQVAFDLMMKVQDDDVDDPETRVETIKQLNNLSLAIQRLEQSASINVKRMADVKKAALDEITSKVDRVADAGKAMTTDDFRQIIKECYGV